eukprot:9301-Heterococcus_DN1.PRE.2
MQFDACKKAYLCLHSLHVVSMKQEASAHLYRCSLDNNQRDGKHCSISRFTAVAYKFIAPALSPCTLCRSAHNSDTFGQATSGSGSGFTSSNGWMVSPQSV